MAESSQSSADKNALQKTTEQELQRLEAQGKIWGLDIWEGDLPPGIAKIRVVRPYESGTCDYIRDRLNIHLDGNEKIQGWAWG
ncbi:hypothetical protein DFH06DRAFT_1472550 [Mycena polygramma]|nr:hypothetical protein DFH06DRAFT_1472550 [Mycena polygramma]